MNSTVSKTLHNITKMNKRAAGPPSEREIYETRRVFALEHLRSGQLVTNVAHSMDRKMV